MKRIIAFLSLFSPLASAAAEPSNEELLNYVRDRATVLEKFTPEPVAIPADVSALCITSVVRYVPSPHAMGLAIAYGSPAAAAGFFDPLGKFAPGTVILKEKVAATAKDTPLLFTGMFKREAGYFPACGDWEFFTADPAVTKILERGKLERCADCHQDYPGGDFVTRSEAKGPYQISGGRIILHASTAQTHGANLHYEREPKKNTLGFWTEAGDWASWTFQVRQPGKFSVHLWQGCGPGSGGSEVEVSCAGQKVKFSVEETSGFQDFKERVIGEVRLDQTGMQTLEVRALSKPGMAVMDLPRIVLVPVATP